MYYCKLAIRIFSRDDSWLRQLQQIEPPENFEYDPAVFAEFDAGEARKGDLIVLDTKLPYDLCRIRTYCKKSAVLIFCGEIPETAGLSTDELNACSDVWSKPLSPNLVEFRLKQVLSQIKLRKEHFLTQCYLNTTIDSIPDLVWYKDTRGAHLKVNNAFCNAVGKTKKDIQGRGHYYIWDIEPEDYAVGEYICLESEEVVLQSRETCVFDEKVKSRLGMRQFKTYKSPLFDEDGELMGTVGIAHDVTDLGNMMVELKIILRSMPFAIMVYDHKGVVTDINRRFEEYFQIEPEEIIGKDFNEWRKAIIKNPKTNDSGKLEIRLANSGIERIVEISEEPIVDVFDSFIGKLFVCRDVTKERSFEQRILLSANTDALTGLYNRRFFYEKIEENRWKPQISLLYVDMDNFKLINDRFGHQVGDDALKIVSDNLKTCCPEDMICRIGGDEFLIAVLGKCSETGLEEKAAWILRRLQKVFDGTDAMGELSASIGIAYTLDQSLPIDQLIKQSDIALLSAKRSGKARYCLYSDMLKDVIDRRGR